MLPKSLLSRKPSYTYKSFNEYCSNSISASYFGWNASKRPGQFPCRHCRGDGKIYDPNDPPCPIEGNKMRDIIRCPKCDGTKCCTKAEWQAAYKAWRQDYIVKLGEYNQLAKKFKSAIKKLTKSEIEAFKALGIIPR